MSSCNCTACNGTGKMPVPGFPPSNYPACHQCFGTGKTSCGSGFGSCEYEPRPVEVRAEVQPVVQN